MDEGKNSKFRRISRCMKNRDCSSPGFRAAKIILLVLAIILALVAFILCMRIDSIEVQGDVSVFNESRVVEASGLKVGGCLYTKPFFSIKNSIRENLPMAQKVSIFKNPFTRKVTVKVAFSDFEYFVSYGDKLYGVDKNLRVTDVRSSRLEYLSLGARALTLPEFEEPIIGEKLVFTKTLDVLDEKGRVEVKGVDESKFDYITSFTEFLSESGYIDRVNAFFADEKFKLRAIVDGKYLVYFGRCENLDTKFEVMDAIIDEGSAGIGKYAVINVENPALASARVDNTLDFSDYVLPEKEKDTETE